MTGCLRMLTLVLLATATAPGEEPILRHRNYAALWPAAGRECRVELSARQYGTYYADQLHYNLIGPDSNLLASGDVALGAKAGLAFTPQGDGLHVLELDPGGNACLVDAGETRTALVASETVPLHTARGFKRLWFYVPRGCKRFTVGLIAQSVREGARVQVLSPDGNPVLEEEGDYDKAAKLRVSVPAGADGKPWSLAILRPKAKTLAVDDVTLWLDAALPPYLCPREEWAAEFGRRRHP